MEKSPDHNAPLPAFRLVADDLAIARGGRILIAGVSFQTGPGEVIILRGANGAGKTSLLRTLAGLLPAAAGSIAADRASIVHVGARNAAKAALSVDENLKFWARLYGAPPARIEGARARLGLDPFASRPAQQLSTGFSRRLGLCRLLIAERALWLVDEPTAALDDDASQLFEAMLADHRARGGGGVIATHEPLAAPGARTLRIGEDRAEQAA